ncbi:hypothetical protein [Microbacterium terricola]|uniref:Uncharacterized protein n=1 Tax=Microbacterium terricola TaxID=344163 RepID=A0ABM8DY73_9MICO|nr:hypothetical protein [Microbacterium terricola]UYK38684.1 hypothetical protein OAU46_08145 [Microbacterium terricola]BDV30628.1 hypothetical protein Microterr_12880 [Microbacterium terricola]
MTAVLALAGVVAVPAAAQALDASPLALSIEVPESAYIFTAGEQVSFTFTAKNAQSSAITFPENARVVVSMMQNRNASAFTGGCEMAGVGFPDPWVAYQHAYELPDTMQPGETITCTTTYTPNAEDVAAGGIFGTLEYRPDWDVGTTGWWYYTLAAEGGSDEPNIPKTATVGKPLSVSLGFWGWWNESFDYQWLRGGTPIAGAVASTYTPTSADAGKAISVKVTGWSGDGNITKTSAPTSAVLGAFTAPAPKVSGTARVGAKLTALPGTWTPAATTVKYQWYRGNSAISGATKSAYTLSAADKGKTIKVKVIGSKAGYATLSKVSASTKTVAAGTITAATPKITGTTKVGSKLTSTTGTWKPSGVTFTRQWYRGSTAITGATKSTYTLTAADRGKTIKVKVTGKKAGYTTLAKVSKATSTIR